MTKKLSTLLLCMILLISFNSESYAKKYRLNQEIDGKFNLNKKFVLNLPQGKWIVVNARQESYYGLFSKLYSLVKLENNAAVEWIQIAEMYTAGIYEDIVNQAIYEAIFKNKHDGCYERPEYYVVEVYKKGSTHNCFRVGHVDVHKDFYSPDDPGVSNAELTKWVRDNNIERHLRYHGGFFLYHNNDTALKAVSMWWDKWQEINENPKWWDNHPEYYRPNKNWDQFTWWYIITKLMPELKIQEIENNTHYQYQWNMNSFISKFVDLPEDFEPIIWHHTAADLKQRGR